LHSLSPKHPHIMVLLSQLYHQLNSWEDLKKLLPQLKKHKVFPAEKLLAMETETYIELIQEISSKNDIDKLQLLWKTISKELRSNNNLIEIYCNKLIQLESFDEAETIIRNILKKEWYPNLVKQYGLIKSSQLEKQLIFAESLSKNHDNNPVLLLTLGRLCMHNDLWGKARAYLEASIGNKETYEAYKELGLLMEYLNEPALAADYFKKGLFLYPA